MSNPKIGCVGLVKSGNKVLAIKCKKGRGLILPGGKFESSKDNTFRECAAREVYEETGVVVNPIRGTLIHNGLACDGYFNYIFKWDSPSDEGNMQETSEGVPVWINPRELLADKNCIFLPDYDILFNDILWEEL